jgi:hypothetical protein
MVRGRQHEQGARFEESLRDYFLQMGYFVVRGTKVRFRDQDVSDVDLWLYLRPSPLTRERTNVDARDRGKPKALERILWAKGLQAVLGLERCVVATTDQRPLVSEFGSLHGVLVLDGRFLDRLQQRANGHAKERLTEEEFVDLALAHHKDRIFGDWRTRLDSAKARLLTQLDFDGCNATLEDARFFLEQANASEPGREGALRLLYLMMSFFCIALDHELRDLAFEEIGTRRTAIEEGLRFGSQGRARTDEAIRMATLIVSNYAKDLRGSTARIDQQLKADLGALPVDILAEHFAKTDVTKELFAIARAFESAAFARDAVFPVKLEGSCQAILGALLDFAGHDRVRFFS